MKKTSLLFIITLLSGVYEIYGQTIGNFSSVAPGAQQQTLVLPSTHTFQRIIRSGDALSLGGTLGTNLDFTGYVPISGSSTNGYLSISSESTPAQVAVLQVSFNSGTELWTVNSGGKVNFNTNDIGNVSRFCSGTVTPNNTIIVSEEDVTAGNGNAGVDSYTDLGWLIEIDPATRAVINQPGDNPVADKLWAIGRANHENAAIKNDNQVLYTGTDDATYGYVHKFVPDVPGVFSSGVLYVLQTTGSLGAGTWVAVANSTVTDRNNCRSLSQAAGGYNFNGVEDVEIGPDGKIYFAAKGEGKIYRFTDNGTVGTGTDVTGLEVFAGNSSYPTLTSYDVDGAGPLGTASWGLGNDNLCFDGEGNLWVLQDGGNNHIWVIGPSHTQASPQVRLFAKTPAGSEPTGITFSPDYNFLFLSFQHPGGSNSTVQTDAAATSVIFNTHTTVVIARTENLGSPVSLPVTFLRFEARQEKTSVILNWQVTQISNHSYFIVERSTDGSNFSEIGRNTDYINGLSEITLTYTDNTVPQGDQIIFYRVKQCDQDGRCRYSPVRSVKWEGKDQVISLFPIPVNEKLSINYKPKNDGPVLITVSDITGKKVFTQTQRLYSGNQILEIPTAKLLPGTYFLTITDHNNEFMAAKFIKK
ncbi:MAG TPA: alkaline phosphatase PhoX [Chitinophagaceae bacterium]